MMLSNKMQKGQIFVRANTRNKYTFCIVWYDLAFTRT